ncbi:MAG: hypothetical protein HY775_09855 [Acidobacteria bacterium]|nr:hypothetical protein [Acidobacteriota bacterium]
MRIARAAVMLVTLLALGAGVLPAQAGPQCMYRYWEAKAGPVRVVSPDSCHVYVYVNGEPLLGN